MTRLEILTVLMTPYATPESTPRPWTPDAAVLIAACTRPCPTYTSITQPHRTRVQMGPECHWLRVCGNHQTECRQCPPSAADPAYVDIYRHAWLLRSCRSAACPAAQTQQQQGQHRVSPGLSQTKLFRRSDRAPEATSPALTVCRGRTASPLPRYEAVSSLQTRTYHRVREGSMMSIPITTPCNIGHFKTCKTKA